MDLTLTTLLVLIHQLHSALSSVPISTKHLATNTAMYDEQGKFDTIYSFTLQADKAHSCTLTYSYTVTLKQPIVISVESEQANFSHPVLFGIRQQLGIISWQIPLDLDQVHQYRKVTRILCPIWNYGIQNVSLNQQVVLYVSSNSIEPLTVSALLTVKEDFFLSVSKPQSFIASPSRPMYFEATFPEDEDAVKLIITSDSDICAVVSIQPIGCPVYDLERNINYEGYYLTMTTKAAFNLKASDYKDRKFYVVVVVKHHDKACSGEGDDIITTDGYYRGKNFELKMETVIKGSEVLKGILLLPGIVIVICILIIIFHAITNKRYWAYLQKRHSAHLEQRSTKKKPEQVELQERSGEAAQTENEVDHLHGDLSVESFIVRNFTKYRIKGYFLITLSVVMLFFLPVSKLVYNYDKLKKSSGDLDVCYYNNFCMYAYDMSIFTLTFKISDLNHFVSNVLYVIFGIVYIIIIWIRHKQRGSSSSTEGGVEKSRKQIPWIYYGMGVALIGEGIMSACYHICPNKSNFLFDTAFMYLIAALCMVKTFHSLDIKTNAYNFFVLYSLILIFGLVGEIWESRIFWIIYFFVHVFGFFLLTLRVYVKNKKITLMETFSTIKNDWKNKSKRMNPPPARPLNAADGAGAAEGEKPDESCCSNCDPNLVLTRIILLGLIFLFNLAGAIYGVVECPTDFASHLLYIFIGNLFAFIVYFITLKVVTNFVLTRIILLGLIFLFNLAGAIYGVVECPTDFASHLLYIFIGNLFVFIVYFITLKIMSWEILCFLKDNFTRVSLYYAMFSLVCWPFALCYFNDAVTKWEKTPAQSREKNEPCVFMDFYDVHDVWHFLSACGLFLSFMMLATMDDDIIHLPQERNKERKKMPKSATV